MFRRRISSSGKIHYRINIDKSMCSNPVDIYIDGDTYQSDFNGSYLDIYGYTDAEQPGCRLC